MKNRKSLGQHWLKDREILLEIADLAADGKINESVVLEIGPGLGTLTSALFKYFGKVVAVELDERLAHNLPDSFPGKKLDVINENILNFDFSEMPDDYVVAGNIPYYITAPILRKILTAKHKPSRVVLLIQKEVAQRLAAGVGNTSLLTVATQAYGKVELGPVVKRDKFVPPPKVDSQVVIIEPYEEPVIDEDVISLAKLGFKMPRKKLASNLCSSGKYSKMELEGILAELGLDINARAADLSLLDWKNLEKKLHKR